MRRLIITLLLLKVIFPPQQGCRLIITQELPDTIRTEVRKDMPSVRQALRAFENQHTATERWTQEKERELLAIFERVELLLFQDRAKVLTALESSGGIILKDAPEQLERIENLVAQIRADLKPSLIDPGRDWADVAMPQSMKRGRELARVQLTHDLIDPDAVGQAFAHVLDAEVGVLRVGLRDTYQFMGTSGDDIAQFFRRELTEAFLLGKPIQGPGSLAESLYESGRLKPITIKTKDGKIVKRSQKQRAVGAARVETAKVVNRAEELKVEEVLGQAALYINNNPEDNRTTTICMRATAWGPHTLKEWDASEFGRPPRINTPAQFHYCRSLLFGGTKRIFESAGLI